MKIIISDHADARDFGPLYGVDIHHSAGGVTRTGFLLYRDERWDSHDEALAAGKQEIAYRAATSPNAALAKDGLSYTASYGGHECEVRVETFQEVSGRGLVLTTPPKLRWTSADGGEALLVGTFPDGRRVVVVKRLFGPFSHESYGRNAITGVTPYWTSVVETRANSERPTAFIATRFWSVSVPQAVSCAAAVQAALREMERELRIEETP